MQRALSFLVAALLLLTVASPAAAATSQFRYTVLGAGAWTSAAQYSDGRFETAWVEIGDQAITTSDGAEHPIYVLVQHLVEVCEKNACVTTVSEGVAENVPFTLDRKKFASASVVVDVPVMRCVDDGKTFACGEAVLPVKVTWSGYGDMIRSHGTASGGISGDYQYTLNGAAIERCATITGSVGGFDLAGAGATGAMYRTRYAERTITHG